MTETSTSHVYSYAVFCYGIYLLMKLWQSVHAGWFSQRDKLRTKPLTSHNTTLKIRRILLVCLQYKLQKLITLRRRHHLHKTASDLETSAACVDV